MIKVSIVIPTRNRAQLLHFALKSAIKQDYKNIEIIVCDNYSADNTKKIVESFNNKNIVYVKTAKPLSMPDNWEFALSKASGDYITYLTDDSYLLPNCISEALKEAQKHNLGVAVWRHCTYFSPDWLEPEKRNVLYVPRVSYKSYVLNSKESLEKLFNDADSMTVMIPKSVNSLCHRSIIERIIKIQHRFFLPLAPDWSSATSILLNTGKYLFMDRMFYMDGVTSVSIGAVTAFNAGESLQGFLKEFGKKQEDLLFLGIPVTVAGIAKSLEEVRKFYLDVCPKINEKILLCKMADLLAKLESNGVNVYNYRQTLYEYASRQTRDIKLAVAKQIFFSKPKWIIVKKVRQSFYLRKIEALRDKSRNSHVLNGERYGFGDIEECAKVASPLLAPKISAQILK